jgi:hypothetical protein
MLNIEEVSKVIELSLMVLKVPLLSEEHKGSIKDSPAANVMKLEVLLKALILAEISVISGC